MTCFQEVAHVKPVNAGIAYSKIASRFTDKFAVPAVDFDEINISCTPRCKLIAYCSGACKEVQKCHSGKIVPVVKDVKKAFTGEVGGRSGFISCRGINYPASE
jgi:hypothetical protein